MIQQTLQDALSKHKEGQLYEASQLYRRVLEMDPNHADALSLMSMLAKESGDLDSSIELAQRAVSLNPKKIALYINWANPLLDASRTDEAIEVLQKALQVDKRSIDVLSTLGDAYQKKQDYQTAIEFYQRGLRLDRSDVILYNNLANALQACGKHDEAVSHYQKALSMKPDYSEAYYNLANSYVKLKKRLDAVDAYQNVLKYDPGHYQAHHMLGLVLSELNHNQEALVSFGQALRLAPGEEENFNELTYIGALHNKMRKYEKALDCYEVALKIKPNHRDMIYNSSIVLTHQGRVKEAIAMLDRLSEHYPDDVNLRINKAFCFPHIYHSRGDIQNWRQAFETQIKSENQKSELGEMDCPLNGTGFYLSYQAYNDRVLQEEVSRLIRRTMPPDDKYFSFPNAKPKVGFISRHLAFGHTIGKLNHGLMKQFSRDKFDVTIMAIGGEYAEANIAGDHPDDTFLELPLDLREARNLIAAQNLDILFYLDIGMDIVSYGLAHSRLAKVQCVTWGHPVTTGIDTMDYFISSKLIEPENAAEHYTEKLALLDTLPTYYSRPENPPVDFKLIRDILEFTEADHVYLCPQSLFKFHPDFDAVIGGILRKDPQGKVAILKDASSYPNEELLRRFQNTIPDVLDQVKFVPRLSRNEFLILLAMADVMLDPLHFGGGNTTYEALAFGTPIVTLPGEFMRGRITAGCYQKMGFTDCIANTPEEYVDIAVRIGSNPEVRQQVKDKILETSHVLYSDEAAVRELEDFFLSVLTPANQGETHA